MTLRRGSKIEPRCEIPLAALRRDRLPATFRRGAMAAVRGPTAALRAVHSGHVGDYVAWLTVGLAILGGAFAVALR